MTLTATYLVKALAKELLSNDKKDLKYWYEIVVRLVRENRELMSEPIVRFTIREVTNYYIKYYSNPGQTTTERQKTGLLRWLK